jgi:short-subunit dehydrogenase
MMLRRHIFNTCLTCTILLFIVLFETFFIKIGWVGVPNTALYSSSKHALRGFFNALRVELNLYRAGTSPSNVGITICTIGATDTEGTKDIQQRITGVVWEDPRVVGNAIVASGVARVRELFYPFFLTYPTIVCHFIAPQLMEKVLQLTMS